jgi:hypothetical protein
LHRAKCLVKKTGAVNPPLIQASRSYSAERVDMFMPSTTVQKKLATLAAIFETPARIQLVMGVVINT